MIDDAQLTLIMILTTLGFFLLAFLLLAPVYLFLKREQKAGEKWTRQILGGPSPEQPPPSNGSPQRGAPNEQDPVL